MTVHQVLVAADPHDAVTNHTLAVQRALAALGPSEVFARYVHPDLAARVRTLGEFPSEPGAALVYHASIGDPDVTALVQRRPEPLVLVYHNITPAEFFDPYDARFAGELRRGRAELAALRDRAVLAVGDSEFNAAELRELGFGDVHVSPLVVSLDRLSTPPDETAATRLGSTEGPVFVFVGQLLPHKRPDFVLRAFHILRTYLAPGCALVLAGPARLPEYARVVRQFAAELALPDVWFTGAVSDAVLAALYRDADAFVTASEHEGFCAPLVEAMASGLPVVARRFGAIPDTLDGGGLLLDPADGPAVFAEAMAAAVGDGLRASLVGAARRRADHLAAVDGAAIFVEHLAGAGLVP